MTERRGLGSQPWSVGSMIERGSPLRIERNIAQCRIALSVVAPIAVYLDPTQPIFGRLVPISGAAFYIDPLALITMLLHLGYSVAIAAALRSSRPERRRIVSLSIWGDVLWAAAIALVTEGANSPFYLFFLFAVLATGLRGTLRTTLWVTAGSLAIYIALILVTRPEELSVYLTRAAYLAITGYLVGFLGRQRRVLEANLSELTRSLHDGYAQALAGVNLRLETARRLIEQGRADEAFGELTELQLGVTREYDDLRSYLRSLQGLDNAPLRIAKTHGTRFEIRAEFEASLPVVEHALQIMLEGARNVSRHARAESATIRVQDAATTIRIHIEDDGVGFPVGGKAPWSIASRAAELGGRVRIGGDRSSGGEVVVELPSS